MRRELPPACNTSLTADCVKRLLEQIEKADGAGLAGNIAGFDGPPLPDVGGYIQMLMRRQRCSPSCAVVALVYIERLEGKIPRACVNSGNIRLLLLTAMMLAGKWLEDDHFSNAEWAAVAGVSVHELNRLELFILTTLHWGVFVSQAEFMSRAPSFWEPARGDGDGRPTEPTGGAGPEAQAKAQ